MPSAIDPALQRLLSLSPTTSTSTLAPHGGSGFSNTFALTSTPVSTNPKPSSKPNLKPQPRKYFIKTSTLPSAATMFEGEHASLNAIHDAVPGLCPRSLGWGELEAQKGWFLCTEFLEMGSGSRTTRTNGKRKKSTSSKAKTESLASKLARLHSHPAPLLDGKPQYGFPVPTCCGSTPQPNPPTASWSTFFSDQRLLAVLAQGEARNGVDKELRRVVEKAVRVVVPRLLGEGHLGGPEGKGTGPVVVHGDLWSGNFARGRILRSGLEEGEKEDVGAGSGTEVEAEVEVEAEAEAGADNNDEAAEEGGEEEDSDLIFDPSSTYAHSEYELGIMRMFGGFPSSFMTEYHSLVPKTEPVSEYDDRVDLYMAYHQLNHWAIFGGGYREGVVRGLKKLAGRYE